MKILLMVRIKGDHSDKEFTKNYSVNNNNNNNNNGENKCRKLWFKQN